MRKKVLIVLTALALLMPTVFAQGQGEVASGAKEVKMGALIRNLNEQFVKDYAENLKALAAKQGVQLDLQDAQGDVAKQLDQLNTLITRGYKYFVIIPQDTSATEQMCKQILKAGGGAAFSNIQPSVDALKVGKTFFYASSPETVAGQYQAEIADEYFKANPDKAPGKKLNIIYIEGQLGHPAQVARETGFVTKCQELGYTVNFVAKDTANWTPDQAQEKMDTWIAAHRGQFNLVVAQNDAMALGAVESMITNKMVKNNHDDGTILTVPVLGIDATKDGLNSMDQNKLYATVLQDSVGQSTTAFELVAAMANGKTAFGMTAGGIAPAKQVIEEVPANDPAIIGQCYLVPFKPVTKKNYKEFM
ncbi:MAG: substrate-binding domain-containing protein [Sphaerochaetaceae bacterium]